MTDANTWLLEFARRFEAMSNVTPEGSRSVPRDGHSDGHGGFIDRDKATELVAFAEHQARAELAPNHVPAVTLARLPKAMQFAYHRVGDPSVRNFMIEMEHLAPSELGGRSLIEAATALHWIWCHQARIQRDRSGIVVLDFSAGSMR